jgi:hypothetical protein
VEPSVDKSAKSFLQALERIIRRMISGKITQLRCDGERGFMTAYDVLLRDFGTELVPVNLSIQTERPRFIDPRFEPPIKPVAHASMSLIDRVIQTIRNAGFVAKLAHIDNNSMKQLVSTYNYTKHNTLTKLMKFDVSPIVAELDPQLETEIRRRLIARNYAVSHQKGYNDIKIDDLVVIYNEKQDMIKRRSVIRPDVWRVVYIGVGSWRTEGQPWRGFAHHGKIRRITIKNKRGHILPIEIIRGSQYLLLSENDNRLEIEPRRKIGKI